MSLTKTEGEEIKAAIERDSRERAGEVTERAAELITAIDRETEFADTPTQPIPHQVMAEVLARGRTRTVDL